MENMLKIEDDVRFLHKLIDSEQEI